MPARNAAIGVDFLGALDEWDLVMRQLNRSTETRKTYGTAVRQFNATRSPTTGLR